MTTIAEQPARPEWSQLRGRALVAGLVCLALVTLLAFVSPGQFFRSYLVAFTFWLGIALGCLVILMVQYLTGGAWGIVLRRVLESGAQTLVLLVVFFVPVILGLYYLYPWTAWDPGHLEPQEVNKARWLNVPWFVGRAVLYFVVWVAVAGVLTRWSAEQDRTETPTPASWRRFRLLSGPGLMLYGLTITFASIDWVMSIEPHWYSTIYPVMFATGQVLTALAFAITVFILLAQRPPLSQVVLPSHLRDLGNLLLTFVMLWAYMQISQFLLIWSGNLPEEIPWYLRRLRGGWQWLALLLVLCHFALPFLLLLARDIKRDARKLALVAVGLLVMRFLDVLWWIEPAYEGAGRPLFWLLAVLALVGLGAVWLWAFLGQLATRPLLPLHDPGLEEALHHE